jgi:predicted amidohydrolase
MIPERYASYEKTVTLGAANFTCVPGDKAANLAKIEATIREAASQGIDIVAFPEEALTGCGGCEPCRMGAEHCDYHADLAETVPGPSTERVAELARELDIYVAFGMIERDSDDPSVLYNAAAFVGPEGIQGSYRKLHLGTLPWVTEGITFEPGRELPIFETRFGPIALIICYDFWFNPELTRLLALKGARVIINCCASFDAPGKRENMVGTTCTRAQENLVYTLSANQVSGSDRPESYAAGAVEERRSGSFAGYSVIAGPSFPRFAEPLAVAGTIEELISATVSFEKLHRWESIFPWREWRATRLSATSELIASEFKKLVHGP